jgi:hypothetical protein
MCKRDPHRDPQLLSHGVVSIVPNTGLTAAPSGRPAHASRGCGVADTGPLRRPGRPDRALARGARWVCAEGCDGMSRSVVVLEGRDVLWSVAIGVDGVDVSAGGNQDQRQRHGALLD